MPVDQGVNDFLVALGLLLVVEGTVYSLAPGAMKAAFERMRSMDEESFRRAGLAALFFGVALVWWVRG